MPFFEKLGDGQADADLTVAERKDREIMRLLLKIKNGRSGDSVVVRLGDDQP